MRFWGFQLLGHSLLPITWESAASRRGSNELLVLDIRGTLAMDVEIGESRYSCLEELGPRLEVASESLSWRREGSCLSCNS